MFNAQSAEFDFFIRESGENQERTKTVFLYSAQPFTHSNGGSGSKEGMGALCDVTNSISHLS